MTDHNYCQECGISIAHSEWGICGGCLIVGAEAYKYQAWDEVRRLYPKYPGMIWRHNWREGAHIEMRPTRGLLQP